MRALRFLLPALLLGACVLPPVPPAVPVDQATGTSAALGLASSASSQSSSNPAEPADIDQAPSSEPAAPVLSERLLSGGLLEIGNPAAPTSILLFTNHSCAYCHDFHREILPRLLADFVEAGQLRVAVAAFPLRKYADSRTNAAHALCAARQGKGLAMHDALFQRGGLAAAKITLPDLGLDAKLFAACLKDPSIDPLLASQQETAKTLGVTLVPTLFLNGKKIVGLPEYPDLRGEIDALLAPAR